MASVGGVNRDGFGRLGGSGTFSATRANGVKVACRLLFSVIVVVVVVAGRARGLSVAIRSRVFGTSSVVEVVIYRRKSIKITIYRKRQFFSLEHFD